LISFFKSFLVKKISPTNHHRRTGRHFTGGAEKICPEYNKKKICPENNNLQICPENNNLEKKIALKITIFPENNNLP